MAGLAPVVFTGIAEYYLHAQSLLDIDLQIIQPRRLELLAFSHNS
jgi:hypothetical protein